VRAVFVVKIHADLDERPALGRERCDELRVLFAGDGGLGCTAPCAGFLNFVSMRRTTGTTSKPSALYFSRRSAPLLASASVINAPACTVPRWLW
jgi:hypothetical protein